MIQQTPDRISVKTEESQHLEATAADVLVVVRGTSFFSGREAFKKAKELNQFVQALNAAGIAEQDIHLQDVELSCNGKVFVTSSAEYRLRIRNVPIGELSKVLTVVANQKEVSLDEIAWHYPLTEDLKRKLLKTALEASKSKAEFIASTLGVRLTGIYNLTEEWFEPTDTTHFGETLKLSKSIGRERAEPIEFHLGHVGKAMARVKAEYKVCEFGQA